jgi:hypothetical protein
VGCCELGLSEEQEDDIVAFLKALIDGLYEWGACLAQAFGVLPMRLRLIAPADLSPEQRPVYKDMRAGIEKNFQGFSTIAKNDALMGHGIHGCTSRSSESRFGS